MPLPKRKSHSPRRSAHSNSVSQDSPPASIERVATPWEPFSGFVSGDPTYSGSSQSPFSTPASDLPFRPVSKPITTDHSGSEGPSSSLGRSPASKANVADGALAIRSAFTLGWSLLLTTFVGFALQAKVPDWLGKDRFGRVSAAEVLATLSLSLFTLGFDTYARKELAVRPAHAREFLSGSLLLRAAVTLIAIVGMGLVLFAIGRPNESVLLFALFGTSRYFVQTNELLTGSLQAVGRLKGLATVNVAAKLLWALIIVLPFVKVGGFSLPSRLQMVCVPVGWIVGESVRGLVLWRRVCVEFGTRLTLRGQKIREVTRASVPYAFAGLVASSANVLDVNLMSALTIESEVGIYRFAQNLTTIAYFPGTILPWVLIPLASRAAARSSEDLLNVIRRGIESVLGIAVPMAVLLALNADTLIHTFASEYSPAIPIVRILAFMLISTYVVTLAVTFLQVLDRSWVVIRVALIGIAIDGVLCLVGLRWGMRLWGEGGAGIAAALAMFVAEGVIMVLFVRALGSSTIDRQCIVTLGRIAAAGIPVFLVDRAFLQMGFSWVRLVADVLVYGGNFLLLNIFDWREIRSMMQPQPERVPVASSQSFPQTSPSGDDRDSRTYL
jgi:O-antigen/teichoic acid export membrane protein